MDASKFGAFVAEIRKENKMTQLELAKKLNVTDKAVSKWERGLSFPDIGTIEPLAAALGVSVLELMKSERSASEIHPDDADDVLRDTFELAEAERRRSVGKFAVMSSAVFVLGIACALLFIYAERAFAQYVTFPMLLLDFVLFPIFIAVLSLFLTSLVKAAAKPAVTLSKGIRASLLAAAALLLALYGSAAVQYLSEIPPIYPVIVVIALVSARYVFSVAVGILTSLSLKL